MATKEVFYEQYCPICKNFTRPESEEPCNECLNNPSNEDSHKPVNYQEV